MLRTFNGNGGTAGQPGAKAVVRPARGAAHAGTIHSRSNHIRPLVLEGDVDIPHLRAVRLRGQRVLQPDADFVTPAVVPDGYIIAFRRDISTIHNGDNGGRRHNLGDGKGNAVGTVGNLLVTDFAGGGQNTAVEHPAAKIAVRPALRGRDCLRQCIRFIDGYR